METPLKNISSPFCVIPPHTKPTEPLIKQECWQRTSLWEKSFPRKAETCTWEFLTSEVTFEWNVKEVWLAGALFQLGDKPERESVKENLILKWKILLFPEAWEKHHFLMSSDNPPVFLQHVWLHSFSSASEDRSSFQSHPDSLQLQTTSNTEGTELLNNFQSSHFFQPPTSPKFPETTPWTKSEESVFFQSG